MKQLITTSLLAAAMSFSVVAEQPNETKKSTDAFQQMKSLVGVWEGHADMGTGPENFEVEYRLTSGGSVVEERIFAGTPKEMVTMYHDKNGKLSLVHYCMLQNQPALVAKRATKESIEFDFDPSCGIDAKTEMHMHSLNLKFNKDGSVTQLWTLYTEGKAQEPHPMVLKRKKS